MHFTKQLRLLLMSAIVISMTTFTASAQIQSRRLPTDETAIFQLSATESDRDVGRLYESFHVEDRYGLDVCVVTRRFEGDVFEQELIEFELESFIPIRAQRLHKVRGMTVTTDIQFQATKAVITVEEPELLGGKRSSTVVDIQRGAITIQQLPYALRTKPLKKGDRYSFIVIPLFAETVSTIQADCEVILQGEGEETVVAIKMGNAEWKVRFDAGPDQLLQDSGSSYSVTSSLKDYSLQRVTKP